MSTNGTRNAGVEKSGRTATRLRSGMKVRVVNPRSQHYGTTGHLLGRNERQEAYWLVRFTTTAAPVLLLEEELESVD